MADKFQTGFDPAAAVRAPVTTGWSGSGWNCSTLKMDFSDLVLKRVKQFYRGGASLSLRVGEAALPRASSSTRKTCATR
jgi:hypothetical protein